NPSTVRTNVLPRPHGNRPRPVRPGKPREPGSEMRGPRKMTEKKKPSLLARLFLPLRPRFRPRRPCRAFSEGNAAGNARSAGGRRARRRPRARVEGKKRAAPLRSACRPPPVESSRSTSPRGCYAGGEGRTFVKWRGRPGGRRRRRQLRKNQEPPPGATLETCRRRRRGRRRSGPEGRSSCPKRSAT
ncbi:MAG: hypothetical protein BJ554DRAFT_5314, partial [Olpidium bornovanus]